MQLRANQGDTLDAICWRHYGRTEGCVEAVLAANPGLAKLGAVLPMGTLIELPELARSSTAKTINLINLWD